MTASGNLANSPPIIKPVEKALDLAKRGFWVFPCKADKTPCGVAHGYKDASNDAVQIRVMFAASEASLVGIACPQSHIHVLDIDVKAEAYYQAHRDEVPDTLQIRSRSGGRHFFFNANEPGLARTTARGGVDVRAGNPASGGYIIAWRDAWEYDRKLMADGFPSGFVAGAHATAAGGGLGTGPAGQGQQGQGANGQARPWPIAERVRWHAEQGALVPDGERDNFLIEAYGHALRAVRDNVAGLEEALAWCGRVNDRLVGGADKDFVGKIGRIMAAQGMALPAGLDVGQFEHVQDGAAVVPFPVGKVAQAQGQFGPVDPRFDEIFAGIPGLSARPGLENEPANDLIFTRVWGPGTPTGLAKTPLRITDCMTRGEISLLVGLPNAGKSALLIPELLAVVHDRHDLIGDSAAVERGGSILWVCNEDGITRTDLRLRAAEKLYGLCRQNAASGRYIDLVSAPRGVFLAGRLGRFDPIRLQQHMTDIANRIKRERAAGHDVAVVVIDTLAASVDDVDENLAKDVAPLARQLLAWAQELGVHIRIVHHVSKAAGKGDKLDLGASRGSIALPAGVQQQLIAWPLKVQLGAPAGEEHRWVEWTGQRNKHGLPQMARYWRKESVMVPTEDDATGRVTDISVVAVTLVTQVPPWVSIGVAAIPQQDRIILAASIIASWGGQMFKSNNSQRGKDPATLASRMGGGVPAGELMKELIDQGIIREAKVPNANRKKTPGYILLPKGVEVARERTEEFENENPF